MIDEEMYERLIWAVKPYTEAPLRVQVHAVLAEFLKDYNLAAEYATGDELSVDEWTVSDNPNHVPTPCCNRRLMKRTVLQGPWEEVK